jgi:hypothetical protein
VSPAQHQFPTHHRNSLAREQSANVCRVAFTRANETKVVTRKQSALQPPPNAMDAAIQIATGVMTDRSVRHRTRPEHDAGPRHAIGGIADVLAVHDGLGWRRAGSETGKPNRALAAIPATVADLIERRFVGFIADLPLASCGTEKRREPPRVRLNIA